MLIFIKKYFCLLSDHVLKIQKKNAQTRFPFRCPEGISRHDCYNSLMSVWIRHLMTQPNNSQEDN
jgi:hypothetical protein